MAVPVRNPMSESPASASHPAEQHPGYGTFLAVWIVLLLLTTGLVLLSRMGQTPAVWGLLTLTPLKAALVFYFFMHLKYEGSLLKTVVVVALGTLLVFFALLFSDVAFR
jgi:cytochrome c oxidase subunit IV